MSDQNSESHQLQQSEDKLTESEKETGHPTTAKKNHGTPLQFRRTNPHMQLASNHISQKKRSRKKARSLQQQLLTLEMEKLRYMGSEQYDKAQSIDHTVNKIQRKINKNQLHELINMQKYEKESIKIAYQTQLNHFKKSWNDYFQKLNERVLKIRIFFQKQKQQQRQRSRQVIMRRWCSLPNKNIQMIDLQRKKQYYLKERNLVELSFINKKKKQIMKVESSKRQSRLLEWTRLEEQQLRIQQSKRYSTLMSRLNEHRLDKEQLYFRQQKQIKQKYKNVISQLKHQQKLQLMSINMMLGF